MSDSDAPKYTVEALQNHGVPITLHRLDDAGALVYGPDGVEFEEVHVRFTASSMMSIESHFNGTVAKVMADEHTFVHRVQIDPDGKRTVVPIRQQTGKKVLREEVLYGLEAIDYCSKTEPTSTAAHVLAFALSRPVDQVSAALIITEISTYLNAIEVALKMAQGLPPTVAVVMLEQLAAAAEANVEQQTLIGERAAEVTEGMVTKLRTKIEELRASPPGQTGSPSGPSSDEPSTSS